MSDLPHFLGLAVVTSWKLASHIMNEKQWGCSLSSWLLGPVSQTTVHLSFICLNFLSLLQFPPDAKADTTEREAGRGETEGCQDTSAPWADTKAGADFVSCEANFFLKNKTLRVGGKHSHGNLYQLGSDILLKTLIQGLSVLTLWVFPILVLFLNRGWQKSCLNPLIILERASWGSC